MRSIPTLPRLLLNLIVTFRQTPFSGLIKMTQKWRILAFAQINARELTMLLYFASLPHCLVPSLPFQITTLNVVPFPGSDCLT